MKIIKILWWPLFIMALGMGIYFFIIDEVILTFFLIFFMCFGMIITKPITDRIDTKFKKDKEEELAFG